MKKFMKSHGILSYYVNSIRVGNEKLNFWEARSLT